jgi:hypothetical protein
LNVEELDEHADEQADERSAEQHDRDDDDDRHPLGEHPRPHDRREGEHRADREVDAGGEDDERHADGEDQQVRVVEQKRRQHARGEEVAEVGLTGEQQREQDRERREHGDPRRTAAGEPAHAGDEALGDPRRCRSAHRATSETFRDEIVAQILLAPVRTRCDCTSTTITTTIAMNSGLTAGGTPRNVIVDFSV